MNTYGPLLTAEAVNKFESYLATIVAPGEYLRRDDAGTFFDVTAPLSPGVALELENLVAALGPSGATIRQAAGLPFDDGPPLTGDGVRLSARTAYFDSTRPEGRKFHTPHRGGWSPFDA